MLTFETSRYSVVAYAEVHFRFWYYEILIQPSTKIFLSGAPAPSNPRPLRTVGYIPYKLLFRTLQIQKFAGYKTFRSQSRSQSQTPSCQKLWGCRVRNKICRVCTLQLVRSVFGEIFFGSYRTWRRYRQWPYRRCDTTLELLRCSEGSRHCPRRVRTYARTYVCTYVRNVT